MIGSTQHTGSYQLVNDFNCEFTVITVLRVTLCLNYFSESEKFVKSTPLCVTAATKVT